jgi:predicted nuclease of predicted toxin-antitoxin system
LRLIVDECLAVSTKEVLKEKGFELIEIYMILETGATDEEIYNYALKKSLPIITHDRGFGEIYHKSREKSPLTIVLQVLSPHPKATNELLERSLKKLRLTEKKYQGKLLIITSSAIRIRP